MSELPAKLRQRLGLVVASERAEAAPAHRGVGREPFALSVLLAPVAERAEVADRRLFIASEDRNLRKALAIVDTGQLAVARSRLVRERPSLIEAPEHRKQPSALAK